jgi:hypothetical protein
VVPRYGYWTQSHILYHYTSLGQDVAFVLPDTVSACAIVHATVGLMACLPGWIWPCREPSFSRA